MSQMSTHCKQAEDSLKKKNSYTKTEEINIYNTKSTCCDASVVKLRLKSVRTHLQVSMEMMDVTSLNVQEGNKDPGI